MPHLPVASLADLPDGAMRRVVADGAQILLVRDGETVLAVGADCPHAGAPLEQGVRNGHRLVCPWHKATFCIRTGGLLDPPAVDDLPCYDVRIEGQSVLVAVSQDAAGKFEQMPDHRTFVIVGAGAAGALAAQTLRHGGFNGRLIMLDEQNRVPYDRTVLSKYFLSGEPNAEKSPLQSQSFYQQHHIERRTARVTRLDAGGKRIECADGSSLTYDAALLATGASPIRPNIRGIDGENVYFLRSRSDADAILARAEQSRTAVVLGASFIGMEVAASLRERGLDVTVVGKESAPFEKQLGARVGQAFVGLHQKRGVSFRMGQEVRELDAASCILGNGERLVADLFVVGFGVKPATAYLEGIELNDDGSIQVDDRLQAAEGLFAAGDIARYPYRGEAIRVEHWRVAEQHGRVAALNMLGQKIPYKGVPVFWTIQYLKRLDYVGHARNWDEIIVHGDLEKPEFLAYYVKDGRVIAAAGLDRDQETAALVELFQMRRNWTPDALGESPSALLTGNES